MRVEVTRSGGVGGLPAREYVLDAAELSQAEAQELRERVELADVAKLARAPAQPPRSSDRFQFDVKVVDEDRVQQASVSEDAASPEVRELVRLVLQKGRPR